MKLGHFGVSDFWRVEMYFKKKITDAVKGVKELGGVLLQSPSDASSLQLQVFGTAATSNPIRYPHPDSCPEHPLPSTKQGRVGSILRRKF